MDRRRPADASRPWAFEFSPGWAGLHGWLCAFPSNERVQLLTYIPIIRMNVPYSLSRAAAAATTQPPRLQPSQLNGNPPQCRLSGTTGTAEYNNSTKGEKWKKAERANHKQQKKKEKCAIACGKLLLLFLNYFNMHALSWLVGWMVAVLQPSVRQPASRKRLKIKL